MTVSTTAVYENGVLRPVRPLDLKDGQTVQLTVAPRPSDEEIIAMMNAAGSLEELFAIYNRYPDDSTDGYDFLKALDENRRIDNAEPLFPPEMKGVTW